MIKLAPVIIVEGKYDKNKVKQIFDTVVIDTSGFGIFKNDEKAAFIRLMAKERGILVLTDSDNAGFMIRNYIKNIVKEGNVYNAYIPDVFGKERRKNKPSAEGKLGVEGVEDALIIEAVRRSGALDCEKMPSPSAGLTKADFYEMGFSGGKESKERRLVLLKKLNLPQDMTANALLEVVNTICTKEQIEEICRNI